ncbi:MAG: hypothetical protein DRP85_04125 [Candidatus Makaraimicrobium thalassicum]|nr:MAG: hypothetical protein DRP85_04125 [Candidatus Omnitrophota bacterium]
MGFGTGDLPKLTAPALNTLFIKTFNKFADATKWKQYCQVLPSSSQYEDYAWFAEQIVVREFKDSRQLSDFGELRFQAENIKFEATIQIPQDLIDDAKYGVIGQLIRQLAIKMARDPDKRATNLLKAAHTTTCYDGTYWCGTAHPGVDGGPTISNYTTSGFGPDALKEALKRLTTWPDRTGEIYDVNPNLLIVGRDDEFTARRWLSSQTIVTGNTAEIPSQNIYSQLGIKLLVLNQLTAGQWFLMDTGFGIMPIIFQQRQKITTGFVPGPGRADEGGDAFTFMHDCKIFGAKYRGVMVPTHPYLIYMGEPGD